MICDTDTDTDSGLLHCELTELTPPWLDAPETLVFSHGVATDAGLWSEWLPLLAPHFRLVRFDLRGFGRSAGGSGGDPAGWTVDRFADDIVAVARSAGAERFHLVGESFGGTARCGSPRAPARRCSRCRASARRTAARRSGCCAAGATNCAATACRPGPTP